jgi:hypothetical protein
LLSSRKENNKKNNGKAELTARLPQLLCLGSLTMPQHGEGMEKCLLPFAAAAGFRFEKNGVE